MGKDNQSLKIAAYWFSIPRIWRRSFFWLVMLALSIAGWVKLFS